MLVINKNINAESATIFDDQNQNGPTTRIKKPNYLKRTEPSKGIKTEDYQDQKFIKKKKKKKKILRGLNLFLFFFLNK